jgi:hypothetical protein
MKDISQALRDLIFANNVAAWADLFTLHLPGGVRRWTTAETDIVTPDARTFVAGEVVIPRPVTKCDAKLEAAEVELELATLATVTVDGLRLAPAAVAGKLDGVRVVVERAGLNADGSVAGTMILFDGNVEDPEPTSHGVKLTATSPVAKLMRRSVPLRIVQASCPFVLYGADCGLAPAAWTDPRGVAAGSTAWVVNLSAPSPRASPGGSLTIGGVRRGIASVSPDGFAVTLDRPFDSAPAVGAAVDVTAGCDRARATCRAKGNIARFGGLPDVPPSEDA